MSSRKEADAARLAANRALLRAAELRAKADKNEEGRAAANDAAAAAEELRVKADKAEAGVKDKGADGE
jgi:hypothetical protein